MCIIRINQFCYKQSSRKGYVSIACFGKNIIELIVQAVKVLCESLNSSIEINFTGVKISVFYAKMTIVIVANLPSYLMIYCDF